MAGTWPASNVSGNGSYNLSNPFAAPGNESSRYKTSENMLMFRFVTEVLIATPIAIIGIVANVLAFVVLCRNKQRSTTTLLLQALAVADTLVLVLSFILRSLPNIHKQTGTLKSYYNLHMKHLMVYLYPSVYFIRLTDTWLTALLTIDRYIAVCQPLHAQRLCTRARTYKNMTVVVVSSFVFSLPRFFEQELSDKYGFRSTALLENRVYTLVYRIGAFSVAMYLLPMAILVVLNTRLLWVLRRADTARADLHQRFSSERPSSLRPRPRMMTSVDSDTSGTSAKKSVTMIVVAVVLVCIACNSTAFVTHLLRSLEECFDKLDHVENTRRYFAHVSNVMVSINSAANFFIYCLCSRNFRTQLQGLSSCCHRALGSVGRSKSWSSQGRRTSTSGVSRQISCHNSRGSCSSNGSASCRKCARKNASAAALMQKKRWPTKTSDEPRIMMLKMHKMTLTFQCDCNLFSSPTDPF